MSTGDQHLDKPENGDKSYFEAYKRALLRAENAEELLHNLLNKLDLINDSPEYKQVWSIAFTHGIQYTGPTWKPEYDAGRAVLVDKTSA